MMAYTQLIQLLYVPTLKFFAVGGMVDFGKTRYYELVWTIERHPRDDLNGQ